MKESTGFKYSFRNVVVKDKLTFFSLIFILALIVIALVAPIIANDKPVYINYYGTTYYPAFSGHAFAEVKDHKTGNSKKIIFSDYRFNDDPGVSVIMPLIPYAPYASDILNSNYVSPSSEQRVKTSEGIQLLKGFDRHLLGTGKRGEDVLSGLIHGTAVSLSVGLFAMIIAGLIGITLGSMAGYFGDYRMKIKRAALIMLVFGLLPAWFYAFQLRSFILSDALQSSPVAFVFELLFSLSIFIAVLLLFYFAGKLLAIGSYLSKHVTFPIDSIVSRCIEILISLPRLILILSLAAIARPSLVNLILIIGLTSWTEIARLTRAEMLKIRGQEFIESARSLGFSENRIMIHHALPNALGPAMVAIAFGIATSILIESALSFLGIGVPQEIVTWGSLLSAGREHFSAWWLVVFPGLAIFATVTAYNLIGEGIRDHLDPKGK